MLKNPLGIEILLLLLAGLSAVASTNLHNPSLISAALVFFCLFLTVAGADALVNKKVGFFPKNPNFGRTETYQGFTAQLWGGIFIFLAFCTLIVAILNLTLKGGMVEFWSILLGTTWGLGILLICIGLVVLLAGIIRLMAGSGGYYTGLQDKVERIAGLIPTLFGLVFLVLGMILFLFPDQLKNLIIRAINLFK